MKVNIHEISNRYKKVAIILTYENKRLLLVRHKDRLTWELPGGRNEPGETILSTAKRELFEETGATHFNIHHLFDFSMDREDDILYGGLFIANIHKRNSIITHEIAEVKSYIELPSYENLTHETLHKELFNFATTKFDNILDDFLHNNQ